MIFMRVLIVAVGTRGDVAPYTGLAARFAEQGHEIAIAAYGPFAELVATAGAEFVALPGDPRAATSWTQVQHGSKIGTGPLGLARLMRMMTDEMVELAEAIRMAAQDRADVLLLSMPATLGYHVAEHLGLPSMGVYLQPAFPTAEHPPSLLGFGRSLGGLGNRLAGQLAISATGMIFARAIRAVRARLDLPPLSSSELTTVMSAWPVQHGYSPTLLPRPRDWRQNLDVAGFLWPTADPGWEPPGELAEFLDGGPPPVYVGFGSRVFNDASRLSRLVDEALAMAGARGVIQAGWTDLRARSARSITIGEAPHSWLFPRMGALVHHAGAGTSAAGLLAGCPTVSVPVVADQPFWAARLAMLGVGPKPVPHRRLTAERLATAIRVAIAHQPYRARALEVSERLRTEDGAGRIVAAVERLVRTGEPNSGRRP
jgi:UDP:flavonoid glycosyltransferase YjiC (YdhE family)